MNAVRRPGPAAWALGGAGLIPFVAGVAGMLWPAALHWPVPGGATAALGAYGAVIVSFLGGIHWGLAMAGSGESSTLRLAWGVVPSLIAWPALLLPPAWGLAVLAAALVLCFLVDRRSYPALGLAAWLPLRALLTAVAALSCMTGAALA